MNLFFIDINLDNCFETSSIDSDDSDIILPKRKKAKRLQSSDSSDSEEDKSNIVHKMYIVKIICLATESKIHSHKKIV